MNWRHAGQWFTLAAEIRAYARTFDLSSAKIVMELCVALRARPHDLADLASAEDLTLALFRRILHRRRESETDLRGVPISILPLSSDRLAERRKALQQAEPNPPRTERENHYRNSSGESCHLRLRYWTELLQHSALSLVFLSGISDWWSSVWPYLHSRKCTGDGRGSCCDVRSRTFFLWKSNGAAANRISGRTSNMDC